MDRSSYPLSSSQAVLSLQTSHHWLPVPPLTWFPRWASCMCRDRRCHALRHTAPASPHPRPLSVQNCKLCYTPGVRMLPRPFPVLKLAPPRYRPHDQQNSWRKTVNFVSRRHSAPHPYLYPSALTLSRLRFLPPREAIHCESCIGKGNALGRRGREAASREDEDGRQKSARENHRWHSGIGTPHSQP